MKNKFGITWLLAFQMVGAGGDPYRLALPGYRYEFPRDHFNHPEFQTEWWYYTGNLHTAGGRPFGFELTFFRQGVNRETKPASVWEVRDVWMAHLALSDIDGGQFFHTERLNRSGPGIAGADLETSRVWNGNWQSVWRIDPKAPGGAASQQLSAVADRFSFELSLNSEKPPVVHGQDGVSRKAAGAGRASHYISLTRLITTGSIVIDGKQFVVDGLSWMDHEFFTHQLDENQTGWDWFSLQFDDGSEVMLFQLRRKDGSLDPYSAGTYVDPSGRTLRLTANDFSLTAGKVWTSPETGGRYPIAWTIQVPRLGLDAAIATRLSQQEMTGTIQATPPYWEGAIYTTGMMKAKALNGAGYLEMTGYAGKAPLAE
jgi:predicted secreted hydrolase